MATRIDRPLRIVRCGCQHGYTLIEVLVAFSVLAVGLTLLLGILSGATRQVRWSHEAGRAAVHAQSLLAQTGVGEVLRPGRRDGEFESGRYRWVLEVVSEDDPGLASVSMPNNVQLLRLRLTVAWGGAANEQRIEVQSLRVVAADAMAGAG